MIIFNVLMFVTLVGTLIFTTIELIKLPIRISNIDLSRKKEKVEVERYREQRFFGFILKFFWISFVSLILTAVCFLFDKFPNEANRLSPWVGMAFGFSFLIFLFGLYITFNVLRVKNNIIAYNRWGSRVKWHNLGKVIHSKSMRVAFVSALFYATVFFLNAITIWFMIA